MKGTMEMTFLVKKNSTSQPQQQSSLRSVTKEREISGVRNSHKMHSSIKEIIAVLLATLSALDNGLILGYSATALPQLQHQESWLKVTPDEASWIASLPALSFAVGSALGGFLMDRFGRIRTLQIHTVPCFAGWVLLALAPNVEIIYAGRLLTGLGGGMFDSTAQVFVSEVTTPRVRNFMAPTARVTYATGLFLVYTFGAFNLQWNMVAAISALVPLVHFFVLFALPESPVWLWRKGKTVEAERALKWFGRSVDSFKCVDEEPSKVDDLDGPSPWQSLISKSSRRPVLTMLFFFAFQQFSGMNAVVFYAVQMFQSAEAGLLTTNQSAMVIGATRILVILISCFLLTHMGRRTVSLISGAGMAASMLSLGAVILVKETPPLAASVTCIAGFIAFNTFGFFTIPWVMLGEVMPERCRGLASGLIAGVVYIYIFIVVKCYPYALSAFGEGSVFVIFGIVSLAGALFVYFFLPETKGKTLQEIEQSFQK